MTYMDTMFDARTTVLNHSADGRQTTREALVVVIDDGADLSDAFRAVCDCLNVAVHRLTSQEDLSEVLRERRPMAVVAEMDAAGQDGCHVLMTVASHDRDLPVLLVTGDDPAMLGAVDAVEDIWELTSVAKWPQLLGVGLIVDFLFRAGRRGNCMRLLSI